MRVPTAVKVLGWVIRSVQDESSTVTNGEFTRHWDNAMSESFWATLKVEFYSRRHWATRAEVRVAVGAWIEEFYNRQRRHSALGYMTPVEFEQTRPVANTTVNQQIAQAA